MGRLSMAQEGKTGQYCLWISGVILLICGIACCFAAYNAMPLISNALESTCDGMKDVQGCLPCEQLCQDAYDESTKGLPSGSEVSQAAKDSRSQCLKDCKSSSETFSVDRCIVDLKTEARCQCSVKDDPELCDCSGTELEMIQNLWETFCMGLGAVGIVGSVLFTGLPALCAGTRYNKCINACCYSVCAGIFSLFFIGAGASFIAIGIAVNGPVGDELLAECTTQASGTMSEGMESSGDAKMDEAANDMVDCAADSMCQGFIRIVEDIGASST